MMLKPLRLHLISLCHTETTKQFESCAYSSKVRKFSDFMSSLGHQVFLYAGEANEADCYEHIVINSKEDQLRWFGEFDHEKDFYPITWGITDTHWVESNNHAIAEIQKRIQPGDFICVIAGLCQKAISDAFPKNPSVEWGIGYEGVYADFKVFESYSHQHYVYGKYFNDNAHFYDVVIPNYFDPKDFPYKKERWYTKSKREDYYVFLGRFIQRKGIEIAVEATRNLGAKLVMAGQGCTQEGNIFRGEDIVVQGDHLSHIGHVNPQQRFELLSKAKACFMPTTYLEPFGGVAIEALLCGTPVIASNAGAFCENIPHGLAGYRFQTIGEATHYASDEMLKKLNHNKIRKYALDNFSTDVIKYRYEDYFRQIEGLYNGKDFYSDWKGRDTRYSRFLP